jgi:hypothetical protein
LLSGLVWLLLALGPLLFLQRSLHREVQGVFLLLTRRPQISIILFSFVFLPGVFLHETSHFVAARLLGVRTGKFSILPRPLPNGRLQLGYVETDSADWIRETLIGAAPLLTGGAVVAYAGLVQLGLGDMYLQAMTGGPVTIMATLGQVYRHADFWLWFYLTFAVSSTMLPSPSDRRAWLPLATALGMLAGLAWLAGAGGWMMENLAPLLAAAMYVAAVVFLISILAHVVLLPPVWMVRKLLSRLTGLEVVRGS